MNNVLTARELLAQSPIGVSAGPTLGIEADVSLTGALLDQVLELLVEDDTLIGLQVLSIEGETLGVITNDTLQDYLDTLPNEIAARVGGRSPDPVSKPPRFRCDAHEPFTERLILYATPALLRCPTCGQQLKRIR